MALTKVTGSVIKDSVSLSGNVSVGGTLTYQDVTNVDALGIGTFRAGIDVTGGDLIIPDKIIHSGDTNTAIRFPSADTITAETAGSERLRIASDGNMGLGTNSLVGNAANVYLTVNGSTLGGIALKANGTTQGYLQGTSSLIRLSSDGSKPITFDTNGSERLRITSAGRVGINETSPDNLLHVRNDNSAAVKIGGEGGSAYYMEIGQLASSGSPGFNATGSSTSMLFQLNGTEKVRIDSSGRLLVATNSASAANSGADDLVIGNTSQGNNGMSIVTNNANIGGIFFADQDNTVRGGVRYQHASDLAQFYAGGSVVLNLKNKGVGINETSPASDALIIRGGDTDDTPSLILKRATDGTQSSGEIIGKLQFTTNENNVDSGNYQPRVEIEGETTDTVGGAAMVFSTAAGSATSPTERLRITSDGHLKMPDGADIQLGNDTQTATGDLRLFHNGSNSGVINSQGALYIQNTATNSSDLHLQGKSSIQMHCPSDGNVKLTIDSSGISGDIKNNYALVAFVSDRDDGSRSSGSTSYQDDTGLNLSNAITYRHGDILFVEALCPTGIALVSTDTANYDGVNVRIKLTPSSGTTRYSNETKGWYRDDGRATKETMPLTVTHYHLQGSDTSSFNDNVQISFQVQYKRSGGAGSYGATGLSVWNGERTLKVWQYRKAL